MMIRCLVLGLVLSTSAALADPHRGGPRGPAPVIVHGPNHGPRGPVIIQGPSRPYPVRVSPTPVYRGPRVIIAPRVINRHWVRYPNVVIVRNYPMAITPIFIPLVRLPYSQTIMQGELWPSNTDYMLYFTHYSISMERNTYQNGVINTIVTLHPQTVCQDPNGCGYIAPQSPTQLRVTNSMTDACGTIHTTAVAMDQFAAIQSLQLTDYSNYFCGNVAPGTTYFELGASIVHYGGYAEAALTGNRSF